jgi:DEAD/DEAH box helicase
LPEDPARIAERVRGLLSLGVRGNLIPKGLARGIIWLNGALPQASPNYSTTLSCDLLEFGYTLLRLALLLREAGGDAELARSGFERAAEAIESVVRNGDPGDPERGFHHVAAACAYHLAHFSARSYTLVPAPENLNLTPPELALAYLLRRSLAAIRSQSEQWLAGAEHSDEHLSQRLANGEDDFSIDELLREGLSEDFLRALAVFDFGLLTADNTSSQNAVRILADCEAAASEFNLVTLWWASKLAKNLISDLWNQSLHQQLPQEVPGGGQETWKSLRTTFIAWLQAKRVAEIELWPSQIEAARRAADENDDLVVSLPTSAGKTRIAELCILRAFSSGKRVVYVTPLRVLSAQALDGSPVFIKAVENLRVNRVCLHQAVVIAPFLCLDRYFRPFRHIGIGIASAPRLKDRDVLAQTIRSGATSRDFFGMAYGQHDGGFDGFQLGSGNVQFDNTLLLIEPDAARVYEEQTRPVPAPVPPGTGPGPTPPEPTPPIPPPTGTHPKSFHGSAEIAPATAKMRLVQIADEIVSLLVSDPNASVKVVVEISAEFPDGAKDQLKRAVSENSRSLGMKSADWE